MAQLTTKINSICVVFVAFLYSRSQTQGHAERPKWSRKNAYGCRKGSVKFISFCLWKRVSIMHRYYNVIIYVNSFVINCLLILINPCALT